MKSLSILYQVLCATFCVVVVISNIISAKTFNLPFFPNFVVPAGMITYPITFVLSDLVTEVFGGRRARMMVYTAFGMSLLSFVILQLSLLLPSKNLEEAEAFRRLVSIQGWVVVASLTAYIVAQIVDIKIYTKIKERTGQRFLWLRNNGSTWTSQLADTLIVTTIYFYFGLKMEMRDVYPLMVFSYLYKIIFSLLTTPCFYLLVHLVRKPNIVDSN